MHASIQDFGAASLRAIHANLERNNQDGMWNSFHPTVKPDVFPKTVDTLSSHEIMRCFLLIEVMLNKRTSKHAHTLTVNWTYWVKIFYSHPINFTCFLFLFLTWLLENVNYIRYFHIVFPLANPSLSDIFVQLFEVKMTWLWWNLWKIPTPGNSGKHCPLMWLCFFTLTLFLCYEVDLKTILVSSAMAPPSTYH